jgi:hypothetical protein
MAAIMGFPKAQPFAFNIAIATVKTSAADLMAQMVVEGKSIDEVRTTVQRCGSCESDC